MAVVELVFTLLERKSLQKLNEIEINEKTIERMEAFSRFIFLKQVLWLLCRMENARFQRTIELKTKEMNRVKKVAKNILDQVLHEPFLN